MAPMFTIIIPVYNVKDYLVKCLDSVANQTCGDWECICVDDGSTDGSGKILDEYVERVNSSSCEFERECGVGEENGKTSAVHLHLFSPPSFRVLHQKNGGVSAARNAALDLAKGEWVQFLDSDDSLELDFLAKLAAKIKEHPEADAIEHAAVYCYSDGTRKIGSVNGRKLPVGLLTAQQILADPFGKKYTSLARCSCYKIFRRAVIESCNLRFYVGMPLGEDSLFATQFYAYADKVVSCPDVAGYLRIFREGSALATIGVDKLLPCLKAMEELYRVWQAHPTPGLAVSLSAAIIGAVYLGKKYSPSIYDCCRETILSSRFFNRIGIPFLIRNGTYKMRLFAIAYLVSPRPIRRLILTKL